VGEEDQLRDMVPRRSAKYARIDALFNNALMTQPGSGASGSDLLDYDPKVLYATMRVMWSAACSPAVRRAAHAGARRRIADLYVLRSSLGGDVTAYSYGASKAALNWFRAGVRATFGKRGIRSNAILPGPIQTPSKIAWSTPEMDEGFMEVLNSPRLGMPDEFASMAVFLASDESRFVNGALYRVDGGMSCTVPSSA